jgi:hypothetical protein
LPAPATLNNPWWSYDIGLIHFIGISTEHNFTVGSSQYLWLKNDLANVNRSLTPWIIFGGHRPMYINSNYNGSMSSDITVMNLMIANLEPLLWKYKVNLGFYGHNHAIQRHSAVYNKIVVQASEARVDPTTGLTVYWHENPQATVHMIVGTGGAAFSKNAVTPKPSWNEMVIFFLFYCKIIIFVCSNFSFLMNGVTLE